MEEITEKKTVAIEFYNSNDTFRTLWIEPACIELVIDNETEYRVVADETEYRIEFTKDIIILWLQYRFSPKVFKRTFKSGVGNQEWILEQDYSDI
jgi:hypothetical protein